MMNIKLQALRESLYLAGIKNITWKECSHPQYSCVISFDGGNEIELVEIKSESEEWEVNSEEEGSFLADSLLEAFDIIVDIVIDVCVKKFVKENFKKLI